AQTENQKPLFEVSVPGHKFTLSEELLKKLDELHAQGKDVSKVLLESLELRAKDIQKRKHEAASRLPEEEGRYIIKETQNLLNEEYGDKCAYHGCSRLAEQVHHQVRFGLQSLNNPLYMVPLCAEHHKIAHAIDLIVVRKWRRVGDLTKKSQFYFRFYSGPAQEKVLYVKRLLKSQAGRGVRTHLHWEQASLPINPTFYDGR
ncbi:MAG: hypothetical protein WC846_03825, partial [Candidatus Gracilibacteria bacterium]